MTTYALFLENVPEPPPPRSHNPGRFVPLFEHARRANGEWVAIKAPEGVQRNRLPNLASRIRLGQVRGADAGEFEVRTRAGDRMLWIRLVLHE